MIYEDYTSKEQVIFDVLSLISPVIHYKREPKKEEIINEIIEITNLGIDGKISFTESLERRIKLLNAKKSDLPVLIKELRKEVSKYRCQK